MIWYLSVLGYKVMVCLLVCLLEEVVEGQGLQVYCECFEMGYVKDFVQFLCMIVCLLLVMLLLMGYFFLGELKVKVDELLVWQKWDLIFVYCFLVVQYVEYVIDVLKIFDFGDMDLQKWLEYVNYKFFLLLFGYCWEGGKMLFVEKWLVWCFDFCIVIICVEWEMLDGYVIGVLLDWFLNGVDLVFFSFDGEFYEVDMISFIGCMDYYLNQECMQCFCDEVWLLVCEC